jgi:hypothetical protein
LKIGKTKELKSKSGRLARPVGFALTPAGVGSANNGAALGVSVLNSNNVASNSNANYGGALTPKCFVAAKVKILK